MKKWEIGELNKGKNLSPETRQKISDSLKQMFEHGRVIWNKNKPHSENTKKKISEAKKGSHAWNKGIPRSIEVKKKISKSKKGSTPWNKGIKRTEEEKQKMREGAKRMWKKRRAKEAKS